MYNHPFSGPVIELRLDEARKVCDQIGNGAGRRLYAPPGQ
jgi:hypothetical protein